MTYVRRREFITLLGGAMAAWPLAAPAQPPAMPVVGYLFAGSPEHSAKFVAAFRQGLSEMGYIEGRNVTIEYRWGQNENDRLAELVADLVRRRVSVIATPGSTAATLAAKAATDTIPVVFMFGGDPVQIGAVASLNRPGGNVTGIVTMNTDIGAKRLGLIHELLPEATRFGALLNSNPVNVAATTADLQGAAAAIGRQIEVINTSSSRDIDTAIAGLVRGGTEALVLGPGPLFLNRVVQLVTAATHYRLPALYSFRENVEAGGLMSYGSSNADQFRQVGTYVGRILKGEKPADLPVMRATRFEFVINLQTAKTVGITFPPALLAIADEVIE